MNDKQVSTAACLAGISESTVYLLENGSAALLTAGEVARIAGELARQSSGQERGEAVAWMWDFAGEYVTRDREEAESIKTYGAEIIPLYACPPAGTGCDYQVVAQFLYGLLDDIDTAGDMAKADDAAYRKLVNRIQARKREAVAECDGYTVSFKTPAPTDAQSRIADFIDEAAATVPADTMLKARAEQAEEELRHADKRIAELEAQLAAKSTALIDAMTYTDQLQQQLTESREREGRMREALGLVIDLASKEWQESDGSRKGATDNQGRRLWFISPDVMQAVVAALAAEKEQK